VEPQERTIITKGLTERMKQMDAEGSQDDTVNTDTERIQEGMEAGMISMEAQPEGKNKMTIEGLYEDMVTMVTEGLCEGTVVVEVATAILTRMRERRFTIEETIAMTPSRT
jgi:hypothetical protein